MYELENLEMVEILSLGNTHFGSYQQLFSSFVCIFQISNNEKVSLTQLKHAELHQNKKIGFAYFSKNKKC